MWTIFRVNSCAWLVMQNKMICHDRNAYKLSDAVLFILTWIWWVQASNIQYLCYINLVFTDKTPNTWIDFVNHFTLVQYLFSIQSHPIGVVCHCCIPFISVHFNEKSAWTICYCIKIETFLIVTHWIASWNGIYRLYLKNLE